MLYIIFVITLYNYLYDLKYFVQWNEVFTNIYIVYIYKFILIFNYSCFILSNFYTKKKNELNTKVV